MSKSPSTTVASTDVPTDVAKEPVVVEGTEGTEGAPADAEKATDGDTSGVTLEGEATDVSATVETKVVVEGAGTTAIQLDFNPNAGTEAAKVSEEIKEPETGLELGTSGTSTDAALNEPDVNDPILMQAASIASAKAEMQSRLNLPPAVDRFAVTKLPAVVALESGLNQYLTRMAVGKVVAKEVQSLSLAGLFRTIVSVIRQPDPRAFGACMEVLLNTIQQHADKQFALTHILRGEQNVKLSKDECALLPFLLVNLRTFALGRNNQLAYSSVVIGKQYEVVFSDQELQRFNAFVSIWCGIN